MKERFINIKGKVKELKTLKHGAVIIENNCSFSQKISYLDLAISRIKTDLDKKKNEIIIERLAEFGLYYAGNYYFDVYHLMKEKVFIKIDPRERIERYYFDGELLITFFEKRSYVRSKENGETSYLVELNYI